MAAGGLAGPRPGCTFNTLLSLSQETYPKLSLNPATGRLTLNSFYWAHSGREEEYYSRKAAAQPKIRDVIPLLKALPGYGEAKAYLDKNRGMEFASATADLESPFVRRFVAMLGRNEWPAGVERAKGTMARRQMPAVSLPLRPAAEPPRERLHDEA